MKTVSSAKLGAISSALVAPVQGGPNFAMARLAPGNRIGTSGVDLQSKNFNWSLGLIDLPGRAGLDLGLGLAYNSLVWTRSGNAIGFDLDQGTYNAGGDISTVEDTLERVLNFIYDQNGNLIRITKPLNGQSPEWVTFGYGQAFIGRPIGLPAIE